jgi:hypothetical protein
VTIGTVGGQCGDVQLQFTGLAAGTYELLLTDANLVLSGTGIYGFTDFTNGQLTTCYDQFNCNTDTANWAVDITTSGDTSPAAPEPESFVLAGVGLVVVSRVSSRRPRS